MTFRHLAHLALAVGLLVLTLAAPLARAHDSGATTFAEIIVDGTMLRFKLTLSQIPAGPLARRMGTDAPGARPDYTQLAEAIAETVMVGNNGHPCRPGPRAIEPPSANVASISASVDFVCSERIGQLELVNNLFDVMGNDMHTIARIDWEGTGEQFAFGPDQRRWARTTPGHATPPTVPGLGSFFSLGIEHILTGYDHLLFLLMLVIGGGSLLELLKIVTTFTIAHSITLALAAFDIVQPPGRFVETVIALSIAFAAAQNLYWAHDVPRRWLAGLVFGLIHGFGFASVLREAGIDSNALAWPLIGFNLGVEAGQVAAIAAVLPLVMLAQRSKSGPRILHGISLVVLIFAVTLACYRALT